MYAISMCIMLDTFLHGPVWRYVNTDESDVEIHLDRKDFVEGFNRGYPVGFCGNDLTCLAPLTPLPPLPPPHLDTYEFGYATGVIQGRADRKTNDSTFIK